MTSTEPLPELDRCARLYLVAWDAFGADSFHARQLADRIADESSEEHPHLESRLSMLVAYGLLTRENERYRLRNFPEERLECWQHRSAARTERLYNAVESMRKRRTADDARDDVADLRYQDRVYGSAFVDAETTFDVLESRVTEILNRGAGDGVVLRSSAELAGTVQQFADRLCALDTSTGSAPRRLEKEATDVVGEEKDELEFRMYLLPA